MVIDLIVQLKKDVQNLKQSKNPFNKIRANIIKKKLLKTINSIHNIQLSDKFLKELVIYIGDFIDSNFSFHEIGSTIFISYKDLHPYEDCSFTLEIRKGGNIRVRFVCPSSLGSTSMISKFYDGSISIEGSQIKDKYTRDIILRIKNAIVSDLYNYIDEI